MRNAYECVLAVVQTSSPLFLFFGKNVNAECKCHWRDLEDVEPAEIDASDKRSPQLTVSVQGEEPGGTKQVNERALGWSLLDWRLGDTASS